MYIYSRYNFKRLTVEAKGHSAPMMLYVMAPEETCIHHNLPNGGVLCNLYVTFTPSNVEYNYLITYITMSFPGENQETHAIGILLVQYFMGFAKQFCLLNFAT